MFENRQTDPKPAQLLSTRTIKFKTAQSDNTGDDIVEAIEWGNYDVTL